MTTEPRAAESEPVAITRRLASSGKTLLSLIALLPPGATLGFITAHVARFLVFICSGNELPGATLWLLFFGGLISFPARGMLEVCPFCERFGRLRDVAKRFFEVMIVVYLVVTACGILVYAVRAF